MYLGALPPQRPLSKQMSSLLISLFESSLLFLSLEAILFSLTPPPDTGDWWTLSCASPIYLVCWMPSYIITGSGTLHCYCIVVLHCRFDNVVTMHLNNVVTMQCVCTTLLLYCWLHCCKNCYCIVYCIVVLHCWLNCSLYCYCIVEPTMR